MEMFFQKKSWDGSESHDFGGDALIILQISFSDAGVKISKQEVSCSFSKEAEMFWISIAVDSESKL